MENPKVSIIIPVFNGEETLVRCLDSVSNQTYKNYEVIVVDNNSTDKTKDIIHEFRDKNNKIKYFFEPKRGRGAARYKGEINSNGDIILMTDSDCIVPKNWIEEMMEPIIKNNQTAVQGPKKAVTLNYWTKRIQEEKERLIMEKTKDGKIDLLDTANFAIKKSVLQDVGYTNPNIFSGNDTELMVRLKIKKYKIYFKRVEILHRYPDTALKVFKKSFYKGRWNGKIRKTYKAYKELFQVTSKMGHLRYFIGLGLGLLFLNENFEYDLVTGIAWRIGLFCGYMFEKKL
jgi:glycosyltransferase involved in cell wall biosynthesis